MASSLNSPLSGSTVGSISADHAACAVLWTESLLVGLFMTVEEAPPNKRLKLSGGERSKGTGALCAGAHELSFNCTVRGGRVARSLSAIR